jgi:arginine N-succinyltransferase
MLFVRPAGPADLPAMMELAALSGRGFTSLPEDEPTLATRLRLSAESFAGEVAPAKAWYTLMLEDSATGRVEGLAGVRAAVGLARPHFSFRVVTLAQYSSAIGTRFDHRALVLVNECGGWTEVGSLFLRPERRSGGAGSLLARSRYMLIGAQPLHFGETVMAELRGWFETDGTCPFWEGVASKFYRLPFEEADHMVMATDGQFILDLSPRHPIYVELISEAACEAIARVHREGEPAAAMLAQEGFTHSGLIDIFDGGPTVSARRDSIRTIADAVTGLAEIATPDGGTGALVSTPTLATFRAVRTAAAMRNGRVVIDAEAADALRVKAGDMLRMCAGR